MLKKIVSFILSLFVTFSMVSCKSNDKILLQGNQSNESLIELDGEELKYMIENKEDFVLAILLESCSSCEQFKTEILIPFIKESKANIYCIYSYELDAMDKIKNKPRYKLAPNLQIYNDGKSVLSKDYDDSINLFKNLEGFKNYMSDYVVLPKIIEVSEECLDSKIANNETFVLYIGWNKCGDCISIYENVLEDYFLNENCSIPILYLESDKYRSKKPSTKPELSENPTDEELEALANYNAWVAFASKYNFASYKDGKVPTIQYYENGILKEMIVYKNDVIDEDEVKESYYKELIGKSLTEEELIEFHNEKVKEFLDKYVK